MRVLTLIFSSTKKQKKKEQIKNKKRTVLKVKLKFSFLASLHQYTFSLKQKNKNQQNGNILLMWTIVILQEVLPSGASANNDTVTPKAAASATINPDSGGSKNSVVKQALDMLKESKKGDDDPKSMAVEGEGREEPIQSKSEHRTEASGERNKERERDRDRERERVKARDRDRGRDSDRERERDEIDRDRDKVKDRKHRSKDRAKDSGWFDSSLFFRPLHIYIDGSKPRNGAIYHYICSVDFVFLLI